MSETINPVLVEIYRGEILESFHRGVVCVVDVDGKIIYSAGDVSQICYPRSALKFFQQIPLLESGAFDHLGLTIEELAVMCGSHNGEPEHVKAVDSILQKAGLTRQDLECGPQYPSDRKTSNLLIKTGQKPEAVHNNCSGKHAGFLAMSVFLGVNTKNYIRPDHPVQLKVKELCSEMFEYPLSKMNVALDGCSAPIFAFPVYNQALAYKNLVAGKGYSSLRSESLKRIVAAVSEFPFMVAGSKRYCTDMMKICGREVIGKTGAEGVYGLTLKNAGVGLTIKVDDGKMLPQYNVAQKFIRQSGLFNEEELLPLMHYEKSVITNFNQFETGEIKVSEEIFPDPFNF